jgi:putative ABC transport system permease protein
MLLWTTLKVALKSLSANKMRSFLAMLGIIIGVAAVISMLALGAGAKHRVMDRVSSMGTNLLVVRPGQRGHRGVMSSTQQNLTLEDAQAIIKEVPGVRQVAPVVSGSAQLKYFNRNSRVMVNGTTITYFPVRSFEVERGRSFTELEAEKLARVAVLGPTTVKDLFGADDPMGNTFKLKGINFRVVGVLKAKGDRGWFNPDDQVIVPYTTAMKQLFGLDYLREIDIQAEEGADLDRVQELTTALLRRRHRLQAGVSNDFHIRNQADILEMATSFTQTFTILLGGIASISMLVGGIGIMNIMLVSVTERTREIGIRKAVGARDRDLLRQFLIEAVIMTGLGGLIGVAVGVGVATGIRATTEVAPVVEIPSILMALSFSAAVGIFFGYYPARRAARLDPIEALRYE